MKTVNRNFMDSSLRCRRHSMNRTVRGVMCRDVITCRVNATAEEIARIMLDNNVSALVVIDERLNACGKVPKTNLLGLYGKDLSSIIAEDMRTLKTMAEFCVEICNG